MNIVCSACGTGNDILEKVGFRDVCSSCDAWLHSCVNCRFQDKSGCTEPSAEKVRDPEGQNFCEWFKGRIQNAEHTLRQSSGQVTQNGTDAKAEAEELWKKLTKK